MIEVDEKTSRRDECKCDGQLSRTKFGSSSIDTGFNGVKVAYRITTRERERKRGCIHINRRCGSLNSQSTQIQTKSNKKQPFFQFKEQSRHF